MKRRKFGVNDVAHDYNKPADKYFVQMAPAHGELVAALYPPDDQWYRARVITTTRADQNVEVCFIITVITKFQGKKW